MQGRTEGNLIDALNTAYDYDMTQSDLKEYMDKEKTSDKNQLSLIPSQNHLKVQTQVMQSRADARMENIFGAKRDSKDPEEKVRPGEIPEYLKKFKTKDSIPAVFRDADSLPSRLAVSEDRTPAAKVVNQSYERQKKIEQKRATENAIQKVANIEADETKPEEDKDQTEAVEINVKLNQIANQIAENEAKQKEDAGIG